MGLEAANVQGLIKDVSRCCSQEICHSTRMDAGSYSQLNQPY